MGWPSPSSARCACPKCSSKCPASCWRSNLVRAGVCLAWALSAARCCWPAQQGTFVRAALALLLPLRRTGLARISGSQGVPVLALLAVAAVPGFAVKQVSLGLSGGGGRRGRWAETRAETNLPYSLGGPYCIVLRRFATMRSCGRQRRCWCSQTSRSTSSDVEDSGGWWRSGSSAATTSPGDPRSLAPVKALDRRQSTALLAFVLVLHVGTGTFSGAAHAD